MMSDLDNLRDALQNRGEVRIEVSLVLMADPPGSSPCARLYIRGDSGRWVKVDAPMLLPPEGGSRGDLLRLLANLADERPLDQPDPAAAQSLGEEPSPDMDSGGAG